ncbi:hypothetical protein BDV59DRAFT_162545 [Aspergillus ambiguus]|uniref:uncharacterized protein n=1 Tax=Aspergillus ambiguus TaxID=176160 RepID=UPI003CCCFDED
MSFPGLAQGLISLANLELYNKACVTFPPPPGYTPPKERIAVRVLENVLNKVVFTGPDYSSVFVNGEVPPHEHSSLAADIVITYLTRVMRLQILCFIEAKRTRVRQSYSTRAVEEEALDYCREFFSDRSNTSDFVYAGTLVGVHLRLWIVRRNEMRLCPLWGSPDLGSNEDYKDLGNNRDGQDIQKAFRDMVRLAPQPWVGSNEVTSSSGGAIQLPRIDKSNVFPKPPGRPGRAPAPLQPQVSVSPTIPSPPAGYKRVSQFVPLRQGSTYYAWVASDGSAGSGPVSEWTIQGRFYTNHTKQLFADTQTLNLPVPLRQ